jgi:hypothetical protein
MWLCWRWHTIQVTQNELPTKSETQEKNCRTWWLTAPCKNSSAKKGKWVPKKVVCNYVSENVEEYHICPVIFLKENEEYAPRKSTIENLRCPINHGKRDKYAEVHKLRRSPWSQHHRTHRMVSTGKNKSTLFMLFSTFAPIDVKAGIIILTYNIG